MSIGADIGNQDGGMSLFIFNGVSRAVSQEEIELGQPDESEAKSLPVHVRKCALRYSIFTRRQAALGDDVLQVKWLLVVLIILMFLTSPQMHSVLEWATKVF